MTKRFFATLLIVLAVLIFLGAAFFLVLFLAPGFSVFGLKYIAADTRAVAVNKMSLTEYIVNRDANDEYTSTSQVYNSVTGIKVESTEIAVNFILSQGWDFEVEYYDNYNGFTTIFEEKKRASTNPWLICFIHFILFCKAIIK